MRRGANRPVTLGARMYRVDEVIVNFGTSAAEDDVVTCSRNLPVERGTRIAS